MGRILALDYGRKRTGVAVTDILKIVPNGLATVPTHTLLQFIQDYMARESVELIVIGAPKQTNNEDSENMQRVKEFVVSLKRRIPNVPIEFVDERFTSVLAHRAMLDGGMKKKDRQNKALVDEISATIILQSYMDSKHF